MSTLRAATNWMRARLSNRPDSEHKQVLVRIVITSLFSTYLGWMVGVGGGDSTLVSVWLILLGELLISLVLFVAILHRPGISHWRRWTGMLADYAAIAGVMVLQGETASPLYSIYLWVTIGNGLRFGSRYLLFATGLSTLSFFVVSQITPYWQANPHLSWGLLFGAGAVPLYFSSLLKALTRAMDDARRANEAKSRFLANMSHELRTPLNGILAMAELLSATRLQKDQRESADMIHTSAQTLLLLIDEVLDISAIEAGKIRKHEDNFDLNQVLSRVYRMLLPQAQAKDLALKVDTDIRVPQMLHGDAGHLVQILLNLLQNAVKFTNEGSVSLHVGEMSREGERIVLKLSVRDTGIGIPEEARQRIFRAFEQVDSGRDRKYGGSGLGTTIAKSLTELMGGKIGIEGNAGGGTHFWVELPFGIVNESAAPETMDAESAAAGNAARDDQQRVDASGKIIDFEDPFLRHRIRVRSMRILVADDQPTNRLVLQRLLEKAGHRVQFAEDGEQVLDILSEDTPDIVLLDLHMPGLSGLEVIQQARVMQAGRSRRTPIVVLSADATVESMREASRAGAHVYLTKPISVPRLLDTIASISNSEGQSATTPSTDASAAADATRTAAVDEDSPILEELAGMGLGADFLNDFVEQCLRDIGRTMTSLQQAAANADYDAMREAAHAMRGVAENVGATRLVERCRVVMRLDNVQIARQSQNLTNDLDSLVEQTARDVRAQIPKLLGASHSRQDPVPSPDP